MKILILSFYYPPDLCAGSFRAEAIVTELLKQIPIGSTIEVITTMPNRYSSLINEAPEYITTDQLTIHRIRLPSHQSGMRDQAKSFAIYMFKALKLSKQKDYDLTYSTSSRLMTAVLGAYVAKRNKNPLYLDIRDIFVDTMSDVLPKKLAFFIIPVFSLLEKWTVRKADKVNLISLGFRSYFSERYPSQKFSYFTNGIDVEFLQQINKNDLPPKPIKPLTILYAGNIGEGQGLHNIIPELASQLKHKVHFRIIGDGGRKKHLRQAIEKIGIDNIKLLDPVNRSSLIKEYQQADILFLHLNNYPAFDKVLPSKVFEYAAMGKPILAGISGYSAKFVVKEIDNATVFPPCDAEQAVHALGRLEMKSTRRQCFIQEYARTNIMKKMAKDILSISSGWVSK